MRKFNKLKYYVKVKCRSKNNQRIVSRDLIPDYQRPYAWTETECQTLWDDVFAFAIPDEGKTQFDSNSEYFLGPIMMFKNEKNAKMEVIDGQQRLTTLMLLLRAFYSKLGYMKDEATVLTSQNIEKCIWKTNEFGKPDLTALKIDSEVATDKHKEEFLDILRTGEAGIDKKSAYAANYRFFQKCIKEFLDKYPGYFPFLPTRIMNNCILLPIEAESQDTALRIFSTLNDRGLPLSDADIFKAQFYKYFTSIDKKDEFIKRWKRLEETCNKIFHPTLWTHMDELFSRYMYYERAKNKMKNSSTEALRKFYEKNGYELLKSEETFENLEILANFWTDVSNQEKDKFSNNVLRRLFVLNYAPNNMWTYYMSVYFMHNRDENNMLDQEKLLAFLDKTIAFIWGYSIIYPSVGALRGPIFNEMINITTNQPVTFSNFLFNESDFRDLLQLFGFSNSRSITKSMIVWWAYQNDGQDLLPLEIALDIEHIYARNRYDNEKTLSDKKLLESLGNKTILEKKINIRASDYKFSDKKKYYTGFVTAKGVKKEPTKNVELLELAKTKEDFSEKEIIERQKLMMDTFIDYLRENALLKE